MRAGVVGVVVTSLAFAVACDRDCGGRSGGQTSEAVPSAPKDVEVEIVTAAGSAPLALDAKAKDALRAHVEHALEICNFRSDKHTVPFGGGASFDTLWAERAAGPHVFMRYPAPHTFKALAGDVSASEVMLAMSTTTGPEPALVRADGKILGLKMCGYDDRLLSCWVPELAKALPPAAPCPPLPGLAAPSAK